MPILVDGHNLIGQGDLPGISLTDSDDEAQLVLLLRRYANRKYRQRVVVIFDRGSYGQSTNLNGYGVQCYFARLPGDADHELIRRIRAIKRKNEWSVVTSDRAVAGEARAHGIKVISSQAFARVLFERTRPATNAPTDDYRDRKLSPSEVEEWLRIFGIEEDEDSDETMNY
ncbi:MAG: hypothetical protein HC837_12920 [Chloroflexaceae bacterium]|nr:hypothetical protein [Chloroflexaceae bacterium]